MNILLDTNIILDILLKRAPHFQFSYDILARAEELELVCFLSATAVTDIHFLLRKSGLSDELSRTALHQIMSLVQLADVRSDDIQRALHGKMSDFEDAVAAEIAHRLKCDRIVTRNIRDFAGSPVPALTPADLIQELVRDCSSPD